MPTAANPNATNSAAGTISSAHGEMIRPIPSITVKKPGA